MFRSICFIRSYSICCRLSTNISNRFRSSSRKNYYNQKRFNYLSSSYLRTCWRFNWSSTSHNICFLRCHNSLVKSINWVRYLPSSWPVRFNIKNFRSNSCRIKALYSSKRSTKTSSRLQISSRYYCYFGYGLTFWRW